MAILELEPDIIILTETKLHSGLKKSMLSTIRLDLPTHTLHNSCITHKTASTLPDNNGQFHHVHGAAGVLLLSHNKYKGQTTQQEVPTHLAGYLVHIKLSHPNCVTTHILGVYMPCHNLTSERQPINTYPTYKQPARNKVNTC